jgi:hypothetical protein
VTLSPRRTFEAQLENFSHEATVVAKFVYAEIAIDHAASKSKRLLHRLNNTPEFWLACAAAFQSSAYIALGRIFDANSNFNIAALLQAMENQLELFQRSALSARKWNGSGVRPDWLDDYLDQAHYPNSRDLRRIGLQVDKYRGIFERVIKPPRNKYIAHREKRGQADVQDLFGRGTHSELWRLTTFLVHLERSLWNQFHNGMKVTFRQQPFSIRTIFANANRGSSRPQERIVAEVKQLMSVVER